MEQTLKKYAVIITIAILFFFFSLSLSQTIVESPEYSDFCGSNRPKPSLQPNDQMCEPYVVPDEEWRACSEKGGRIEYEYNESGCQIDSYCEMCHAEYDTAREKHERITFLIGSVIGVIAVIAGIFYSSPTPTYMWISSGILIGGIASIFMSTARYYNYLPRFLKPVVLLIEIILVSWVAIAKYTDQSNKKAKPSGKKKRVTKKKK